jgi:hypothetical protein
MLQALLRVVVWSLAIGGVCFAAGFFGPMIFAPGANQGPLLGILITGPLGVVLGLATGVVRELLGCRAGPLAVLRRIGVPATDWHAAGRFAAAFTGIVLVFRGIAGLRAGEGRPAAAAIVVAVAILSYATYGRIPAWFRR